MKKLLTIMFIGVVLWASAYSQTDSPFGAVLQSNNLPLFEEGEETAISELFGPFAAQSTINRRQNQGYSYRGVQEGIELPKNVLVLMVEFPNTKFADNIDNIVKEFEAGPEYTISDYVSRYMYHLRSYYLDVSKDAYEINYTVLDTLIMMDNPMEFYGEQGKSLQRRVSLAREVVRKIDPIVDFSEYDAYVLFHSGAGKETDVYGQNPHTISSSFLNRRILQAVLAPDDEDFPGIGTNDGVYIQEMVIAASHQTHKVTEEETNYSVFGLLAYLFGRQIGLPTLFGNVSALGSAAGAGNFCIMGTGAWNANGHVPPYLSGWSRYFMGWEDAKLISSSREDLKLDYPFKKPFVPPFQGEKQPPVPRLYKIPISATEYYLVENREQNPDNNPLGFTFQYLPEGEQDYYPKPNDNVPRFNFMKNSYRGSDWDFYLPGYGGPGPDLTINGSGIFIWHIDETVIKQYYKDNVINANPEHQAVTLIEADGIQHLRSSIPNLYMRGSPYDSFRKGHNDYLGYKYKEDGTISNPFVQSYYGSVDLEIHSISASGPRMSFSVSYPGVVEFDYDGADILPVGVVENICSGAEMLFIATESGKVFFLVNDLPLPGYPKQKDPIPHLYAYSPSYASFFVPTYNGTESKLLRYSAWEDEQLANYIGYEWATHPAIYVDETSDTGEELLVAALQNEAEAKILIYDLGVERISLSKELLLSDTEIVSNMMLKDGYLYVNIAEGISDSDIRSISRNRLNRGDTRTVSLLKLNLDSFEEERIDIDLAPDKTIKAALLAPITESSIDEMLILTADNGLYLYNSQGSLADNFPVYFDADILSVPILEDISSNGHPDILMVSYDELIVLNYAGEIMTYPTGAVLDTIKDNDEPQSNVPLGVITADINGNGKKEIIANIGFNRMAVWDNSYRLLDGYPLVFQHPLRHSPVVAVDEEKVHIYAVSEKGSIYRQDLLQSSIDKDDVKNMWNAEFADLQRTASYNLRKTENKLKSSSLFIKEHCYAFPSPLSYENGGVLYFNIMVSETTPVDVKIFDISGKLVFEDSYECYAYVNNRNKLSLSLNDLSTGVYFALLTAKNSTIDIRFAVEK